MKLYNPPSALRKKTLWRKRSKKYVVPSHVSLASFSHHGTIASAHSTLLTAPPMPASLQNNIRRLRFDRGMTQEELALRVGVSRQTIMSIERGATNPSVLLAYKVSMALQAPISEVFRMEGGLMPV